MSFLLTYPRSLMELVGLSGLEPPTSRLSGVCSNQLSYKPICCGLFHFLIGGISHSKLNSILYKALVSTLDAACYHSRSMRMSILRKEVIQPHLPIRLPCYDFTLITNPTFDCCPLAVCSQASGVADSHGVTGGVYKARERIHRGMLIRDY